MSWTTEGRVRATPAVALLIAALGAVGLLTALAGAVSMWVRGGEGALWFVHGFLGLMALVMFVAGRAAARAEAAVVWVDGERVCWRDRGQAGERPLDSVGLEVRRAPEAIGRRLPHHTFALVERAHGRVLVDDLGGRLLVAPSSRRLRRMAKRLGIAAIDG